MAALAAEVPFELFGSLFTRAARIE